MADKRKKDRRDFSYYMQVKDYRKAYESYMRAYSIDKSWGTDKADQAKQLYEKQEGRSLNIVPV